MVWWSSNDRMDLFEQSGAAVCVGCGPARTATTSVEHGAGGWNGHVGGLSCGVQTGRGRLCSARESGDPMVLKHSERSLPTLLALCAATVVVACEPMAPSGDPLSAVPVQAAAAGGDVAPERDPRFPDEGPVELSSEDLQKKPTTAGGGTASTTKVGAAAAPAATSVTTPAASAASTASTASEATPQAQPVVQASAQAVSATAAATAGWPIRLVRTHLDEQPPSAILALPDGRRIVVSPGDMVPERGLVVMAIGRERVQLAAINSNGDHATVVPMELSAQY